MNVEKTVKKIVTEDMLAVNVDSGSLKVLGTPVVAALFENAAMLLAGEYLEEGSTTVGCSITVNHVAPTPLGGTVTATAKLVKHEGRFFDFELKAEDEGGVIADGVHQRVAVFADKFQQKADGKLAK